MSSPSLRVLISFCLVWLCSSSSLTDFEQKFKRTFVDYKLKVNPDCKEDWCSGQNDSYPDGLLVYTKAKGPKDTIHHLFSTVGSPTLMMSRTDPMATLTVNYTNLKRGYNESISFTPKSKKPVHSFGIIFSRLFEFEDYNDTANLSHYSTNRTAVKMHDLTDLQWIALPQKPSEGDDYLEIALNGTGYQPHVNSTLFATKDSYLSFRIRYDDKHGRLDSRPHMEFTANSSTVTLVMSNLTTKYKRSRFAVEMVMFSTSDGKPNQDDATQVNLLSSLDDEYSPGVFQMHNWYANESKARDLAWGYAQWKPVMYKTSKRVNADLSHATSYPNVKQDHAYLLNNDVPKLSLFNSSFVDKSMVQLNATNVSFGETADKYYRGTKYVVWTMSVGLGPAPEDEVSITVVMVIAVGLGIPLILMVLSSIYVCVKNYRKKNESTYVAINS